MDPERLSDIHISDVVLSTAGRDKNELFYVIGEDPLYLTLANGKDRPLDRPKLKSASTYKRSFALRPESPTSYDPATKCSTANYEEIWHSMPVKCKRTT